ncbi:hypothetical protein Lepto7375DRAFT_2109 [Leptolyngbya sp. PCC 7375]|nr:hypothetical protein Lepto7375DRAFT_2109 [Leptolyngbya sp. PCC 7375]
MTTSSFIKKLSMAASGAAVMALGATFAAPAQAVPVAPGFDLEAAGVVWDDVEDNDGFLSIDDGDTSDIGGGGDHFDEALAVRIGGEAYGVPGNLDLVDTTVTGTPQLLDNLDVTVQLQANTVNPIMRQLVEITNNTLNDISTVVQWINNTGNDSNQRNIGTSSGDLAEGLDDRWIVTADSSDLAESDTETNAWILYGPSSPSVTTSNVVMFENEPAFGFAGSEGLTADFNLTVGAGETNYLMWFVGMAPTGNDGLSLAAQFDDTETDFFSSLTSDLSQEQLDSIVNWDLAETESVPEPGSILALLSFVGIGTGILKRNQTA